MKKKLILLILVVLLIAGVVYYLIQRKESSNELTLYGNIEIRQVDLSFQVGGQIEKMLKEEGDTVKSGDLVALLDDRDYRSNMDKADADVGTTLALYKDAEAKYQRQEPLCFDNTISKLECDSLLNTRDRSKADYEAAIASQTFAKNQLDYTKLYAPEEGTITVRVQEPGATVTKGQIVYTMSKTRPVWIRAYINETDLGNIKYGMDVKVYTDTVDPKTNKKRIYNGYVGYISPVAEFTPKTVESTDLRTDLVYRIRVYIDNIDEYLRQGMPVTIKINLSDNTPDEHNRD